MVFSLVISAVLALAGFFFIWVEKAVRGKAIGWTMFSVIFAEIFSTFFFVQLVLFLAGDYRSDADFKIDPFTLFMGSILIWLFGLSMIAGFAHKREIRQKLFEVSMGIGKPENRVSSDR